jgi:hypothetical protein
MNFIVGLPMMTHKFDSIWVIMDRLSKSAHFIPVHTRYDAQRYAEMYIARVLCLHGVSKMIISDRGSQFSLSPTNGWPNWASQPNTQGYAESMCSGTSRKPGSEFTLGQILLQQQLPREFKDGTIQSVIRTLMPHSTQLDWTWREGHLWTRPCQRGWSNRSSHPR